MKSKVRKIVRLLSPICFPLRIVLYLLWGILSIVLFLVLTLVCMVLLCALLGLPGPILVSALFDNPPNWLLVISVMPGGLGMYWGLNLAGRIADTGFFRKICLFKDEDIDKGVREDFMNR